MCAKNIVVDYKCGNDDGYHSKQVLKPYRSTVKMVEWLKDKEDCFVDNSKILDMACGGGGNLAYMSKMFPSIVFEGIDYDIDLVDMATETCKEYPNVCSIVLDDWFNLDDSLVNKFDGIISFQTLSWIGNHERAIMELTKLNPKWIALSSLFFEGDIDYYIDLSCYKNGYEKSELSYKYNVYSLPRIKYLFGRFGYKQFDYVPFNIDIDLNENDVDKKWIGTYTKKLEDGSRIQISGGMMMPWYFVLARK